MPSTPIALSDQRAATVLNAIRTGSTLERAASFAGISHESIKFWRRRGEQALAKKPSQRSGSENKYVAFLTALDEALAACAVRMQAIVYETAVMPAQSVEERRLKLQAATWWLTHRERKDYTTRQELTVTEVESYHESEFERDVREHIEKVQAAQARVAVEEGNAAEMAALERLADGA